MGGEKGGVRGAVFFVLECGDGDTLFRLFIFFRILFFFFLSRFPTIREPGESSREAQKELMVGCGSNTIFCDSLLYCLESADPFSLNSRLYRIAILTASRQMKCVVYMTCLSIRKLTLSRRPVVDLAMAILECGGKKDLRFIKV